VGRRLTFGVAARAHTKCEGRTVQVGDLAPEFAIWVYLAASLSAEAVSSSESSATTATNSVCRSPIPVRRKRKKETTERERRKEERITSSPRSETTWAGLCKDSGINR